jgi:hypothetical protein
MHSFKAVCSPGIAGQQAWGLAAHATIPTSNPKIMAILSKTVLFSPDFVSLEIIRADRLQKRNAEMQKC